MSRVEERNAAAIIFRTFGVSMAAAILSAAPVLAQSSSGPDTRIGFGVALSNVGDDVVANGGVVGAPSFEVPIGVTTHVRVQPEFRYQRIHTTQSFSATLPGTIASQTSDSTAASTWFGTSVLYNSTSDRLGIYIGGKAGLVRTTQRQQVSGTGVTGGDRTTTANGYFVGPVIGGEYFLHDRFSLGAAMGVVYQSIDSSIAQSPGVEQSMSQSTLLTRASFTARVYLR